MVLSRSNAGDNGAGTGLPRHLYLLATIAQYAPMALVDHSAWSILGTTI
jgi:hypothetical protein